MQQNDNYKIAVIGLGYVGLPVALALGKKFADVTGFDINPARVAALQNSQDATGEAETADLQATATKFSANLLDIAEANFYIVCVPTPIDANKQPDLQALESTCLTIGKILKKGDVVVFESTVYPGVTEEFCGPILAKTSGLQQGRDFKLSYSPERINPGDKQHRLENTIKVVAGEDAQTLAKLVDVYGAIVTAGLHQAPSIKVAEAAKVIENSQRDINIAFMNELALIFDKLGIRTSDVLAAAGTKWNFLKFTPGLVGGHCIGVDPFYLAAKAEELGYHPQVILAGRRINDSMGAHIASKAVKLLVQQGKSATTAKIGILGLTFKENVPDIRNSRVPDILAELKEFGANVLVHDPHANPADAMHEYGVELCAEADLQGLDLLILAVPHKTYLDGMVEKLLATMPKNGVVMDVKSVLNAAEINPKHLYWSL